MDEASREAILAPLRARVGLESAPTVTEIHPGLIRKFCAAIGETHRIYLDEAYARSSRYGGLIAPPTFVCAFTAGHFPDIIVKGIEAFPTTLHADDVAELHRPIRAGDVITARARYAGAEIRQGGRGLRLYQSVDLRLTDAAACPVADVRIVTVSF